MKTKKILIFNPFGIGDVLFTTPLIRNLKENIEAVSITYLCNRRVEPLLKSNPYLDNVFVFEKDEWKKLAKESRFDFLTYLVSFFCKIRKEHFDMVFDLSLNSRYGFFLMLAGISKRIGFNFKNRGRFLTQKIDIQDGYSNQHVAHYYLNLLKFLEITPKEYKFDLTISEENLAKAKEILGNVSFSEAKHLVAVCPGSGDSWGGTAYYKRWPPEYFLKLCQDLQEELGVQIILLGSQAETDICEYVHTNLKAKALNLCAKISLEESCALISLCKLLITNDGGPFHIAQALGKKAIVLYGPVNEKVYGPYPNAENSIIFTADVSCRPCYKAFKFKGCPYDKKCLRDIKVEEVFSAAKKILIDQK